MRVPQQTEQLPARGAGGLVATEHPVMISYLVRLGVEKRGEEYLSFPQRALLDKLGIRNMVIETDPFGNFLGQGYEVGSGRDWSVIRPEPGLGTAACVLWPKLPVRHLRFNGEFRRITGRGADAKETTRLTPKYGPTGW